MPVVTGGLPNVTASPEGIWLGPRGFTFAEACLMAITRKSMLYHQAVAGTPAQNFLGVVDGSWVDVIENVGDLTTIGRVFGTCDDCKSRGRVSHNTQK